MAICHTSMEHSPTHGRDLVIIEGPGINPYSRWINPCRSVV